MPDLRFASRLVRPALRRSIAVALAALLLAGAAPARNAPSRPAAGTPVQLREQRGTATDTAARQLVADDLAAARARGDRPLVLIATASLGGERPALFVQLQSPKECGSAGCATSAYAWERGAWRQVLDGATGKLTISGKRTRGWFDLVTDEDHFVWTGTAYRSTQPAPAVDLRPTRPGRGGGRPTPPSPSPSGRGLG